MAFAAFADIVVVVHSAFIGFVVVGGLVARRRPALARYHAAALAWGAGAVIFGWACPLTALEKWSRRQAGEVPYRGGFVDRYLEDVLYPAELTPLLWLAVAAVAFLSWPTQRARRRATHGSILGNRKPGTVRPRSSESRSISASTATRSSSEGWLARRSLRNSSRCAIQRSPSMIQGRTGPA